MPASLLASQFEALEPPGPECALTVDVGGSLAQTVDAVLGGLEEPPRAG